MSKSTITVYTNNEHVFLETKIALENYELYDNLIRLQEVQTGLYQVPLTPLSCFVLTCFLHKIPKVTPVGDVVKTVKSLAKRVPPPRAYLSEQKNRVLFDVPMLKAYRQPLQRLSAVPRSDYSMSLPIEKALDAINMLSNISSKLPQVFVEKEVKELFTKPIAGFTGDLKSLKTISLSVLNSVNNSKDMDKKFAKLGINSLYDLLFYLPYRHIDKSNPQDIKDLVEGETCVVEGTINTATTFIGTRAGGAKFTIKDSTGFTIPISFFNQEWLVRKFKVGSHVLVTGKLKWFAGRLTIAGTSIEFADEAATLPIVPVYKQSPTNGVSTYRILCAIRELLLRMNQSAVLAPYFPNNFCENFFDTVHALHIPENMDCHSKSINTMAMYELFYVQVLLQLEKLAYKDKKGIALSKNKQVKKLIKSLPFTLTDGQAQAVSKLQKLLSSNTPTESLLSADVGAGKTVCAQICAIQAVENGGQAVILAPTEVLARQLYTSTLQLFNALTDTNIKPTVMFYSGALNADEKKKAKLAIKNGEAQVIIGTQGLLQKNIVYHNLVFVAIDEQQKFGTEQRQLLLNARSDSRKPHVLMQTATPIPRSIAQIIYGDVHLISLKDKPSGRLPVQTTWVKTNPNDFLHELQNEVWDKVYQEVEQGHQVFVVTPLVEESVQIEAASAKSVYDTLTNSTLKDLKIGLVHGQMKKDTQQQTMQDFRDKKYDVLVCSTIVEVGVDIPDATVVVVLSADRMGASSLHQIRGRVGRNSEQSYCYLIAEANTKSSESRLNALVECNDGFEIAQRDLETRGEGKILSFSQSGKNEMRFISLLRDKDKIDKACMLAKEVLNSKYAKEAVADAKELFCTQGIF